MRARSDEMMLRDPEQDAAAIAAQRAAMVGYQAPLPAPYIAAPMQPAMPPELPQPSIIKGVLRNFWLVLLFALVGAAGAWMFLKHARPLFTSESKIYIEPVGPRVLSDTLGSAQRSNYLYTQ